MPPLTNNRLKIPKYVQLAEYLRSQIASGHFVPDDRLPSLNDLKLQFGANQHTVEKAHALLESDGLIRREPGRGVFVEQPAQRQLTGNVGFLAPYNMRPEENVAYWGSVLAGMRSVARDRGYHLLLIDNASEFADWDKVDGAIFCDTHDPRDSQPGTAYPPPDFLGVSIFNTLENLPCVTTDDFDGAYQLTRHLIELGHRKIAFLGAVHSGLHQLEQRKGGYLKALMEAGIQPHPRQMRELIRRREWDGLADWYFQSGEHTLHCWMEDDWDVLGCTALVAQNDNTARGVIQALRSRGLAVPRDVSVTGFDGLLWQHADLQLTTIQVPLFEVGERAMQALLDYVQHPTKVPPHVTIPVTMIPGHSTAEAPLLVTS